MVKALVAASSLGGRPKFFGSLQLGYGWRIRNWWVDMTTFFNYEYRNVKFFLNTYAENLEENRFLIQLRMKHVIQGGLDCRLGYYMTQNAALLFLIGFEIGHQGTFKFQSPRPPFIEATPSSLPDAGIRLGIQAKFDLQKNWSMILGYQNVFLSKKGIVIHKSRSFLGVEYSWLSS